MMNKLKAVTTTREETETQQHRDQITKLRGKNWKRVLSGDTNNNRQLAKTTETSKYVQIESDNEDS